MRIPEEIRRQLCSKFVPRGSIRGRQSSVDFQQAKRKGKVPKVAKFALACLLCIGVIGALVFVVQRLF
ncbi:MAG: hypothetical protein WAU52_04435 [Burkholderiales bacterium]